MHKPVKSDNDSKGRQKLPSKAINPTTSRGKIRQGRVSGEKRIK